MVERISKQATLSKKSDCKGEKIGQLLERSLGGLCCLFIENFENVCWINNWKKNKMQAMLWTSLDLRETVSQVTDFKNL